MLYASRSQLLGANSRLCLPPSRVKDGHIFLVIQGDPKLVCEIVGQELDNQRRGSPLDDGAILGRSLGPRSRVRKR